jgi:hypothetical protein
LTADGPFGADLFLYLNEGAEPLHEVFGRLQFTGPPPFENVIDESEPPTGSEPVIILGSSDSKTSFPLLSNSFLPVMPWSVACAVLTKPSATILVAVTMSTVMALVPLGLAILSSLLWAGHQSPRGWKARPNAIDKQKPKRFCN